MHSKRISILFAWYDSSFQRNKLRAASSCRRVIETKSGKVGCSIQAVLEVVSAPARFWERGTRCFEVRLCVLERLVTICSVFWRIDDSGFENLQEWYGRNIYAVRIEVNRWFFAAMPALNMPRQAKGVPSRAAQGDRKSGANGCWGTPWSDVRLVASLTATSRSGVRLGAERKFVFWTSSLNPPSSTTRIVVLCLFQRVM